MFRLASLGLSFVSLVAAAPVMAQESDVAVGAVYLGAIGGYHDLEVDVPGKDGGAIFGGVVGFDVPVSGPVTLGVEGNFEGGTGAIDKEYGVAARLGYRFPSGGIVYVRGGYQWINLDVGKLAGVDIDDSAIGISDTVKDYLVGLGGELPLSDSKLRLRAGIDTVSFDTVRPTLGVILGF